jgi:acylphosphatase
MSKHFDIKIYGQVQGKGFRFSAKEKADKLKIFGFVQNMPDGSVYIEAEGDREDLETFISWCKKGPMWASVDRIEFEESAVKGYNNFDIKH